MGKDHEAVKYHDQGDVESIERGTHKRDTTTPTAMKKRKKKCVLNKWRVTYFLIP